MTISFHEIKFKFDGDVTDDKLDDIFKTLDSMLNIRFNGNLKPYIFNNKKIYEFSDVSQLNHTDIEEKINSFFKFTFKEVIDVPLYKFLVLKNKDKLIILANIHSLIFDYSSIKDIYNLFNGISVEKNILNYYNNADTYLSSQDYKNDAEFWNNHFSDTGNYIKFYNIKSNNYENIKILLKNEKITEFSQKYNVSRFDFITAVFSLYLSRINRTEGSILKTNISYNDDFDKSTLLKIKFSKDNSFIEYLNEIREVRNLAFEHTKVDIDKYIDENFSCYCINDFSELKNISVKNGDGSALTLNLYEEYMDLVYNSDLFSDVFINHMAKNIEFLIDNVLNSPNQQCKNIDILSNEEKELLSNYCKGKTLEFENKKTLAMSFRENALKYPDLIAVNDGVSKITYAELESSSNSVAYDLRNNHDINFGDCVGLMLPRTYHFLEIVISLNKLGVIFVPIDPYYPLKRVEYMLDISEANCIITTRDLAEKFGFNENVIYFEDLKMDYDESVECLGSRNDLFSIIFTSGTTGLPKGVMISNKQLENVYITKDIFGINVGDVVGYFASFSFIAALRMYTTLALGETCRIFNEKEQRDMALLIKGLKEQEINNIILPPALGIHIFEREDINIKYLIFGGAKLNELKNKKSTTKLVNFYGSTEIPMATMNIFDANDIGETITIGRANPNSWAYILDSEGMQLPIGVAGEICVSCDYLSPGYYNRPDLTKKVFVDNPYSTCENNKMMYRTGDIGFYNFDGQIVFLGREDEQLSVRGYRIESGEILKVMKTFKNINEIYLDVENDTLIAYYTLKDDLDINKVKDSLKSELPYFMVPSLFIELDEIPLNANGKLNKDALKNISQKSEDIEINDDTLKAVLDSFKNVLDNDSVLIEDGFIELGGTSLSAMHLQKALKDNLDVILSSNQIIELSTPQNIAEYIKSNLDNLKSIPVNYTFDDKCPLSDSQLNVYFDELVNDIGTGYNNPFKIEFDNNEYSADEIRNALIKLFEITPVLKSRIKTDDGTPMCVFDAEVEIDEGSLNNIKSFVRPFELDRNLSRFLIVEDEQSIILCGDIHHLVFDGTSFDILSDRFYSILNNVQSDFVDDGILKQISFEENISSNYESESREFFNEMLTDREEVYDLLPTVNRINKDHPQDVINGTVYMDAFEVDSECLNSFLKKNVITHNQFYTSVFAYTLSRFTGSSKVLFNLIEDGRGHVDLSDSVGMFVKTLPLLIDCSNQDVESFVKKCSKLVTSVMKYDLYPFHVLSNEHNLSSDILFQYSHNLFNQITNNEKWNYNVVELEHDTQGDLSFFIFNENKDKLGIKVSFSDKFSKTFIEQFVKTYKLILKEMTRVNELSEIEYTTSSDLKYLDDLNTTEHELKYNDILDVFNDNLTKYNNSSLVSMSDRTYTYGESAFIADKLAKELLDFGVKSNDNVGFLTERSENYMFSILAILSVGAVYVPLDDNYPDKHLQHMIKDANLNVVIVSDETYNHVKNLSDNITLLNISDILKNEIGSLSSLPVIYNDVACILYTSGTTGLSKGVMIKRKSIVNYVEYYVNKSPIDNNDKFALFASIGFDVGAIKSIFVPLYCGCCLDIIPNEIKLSISKLNNYFNDKGITHATSLHRLPNFSLLKATINP